MSPPGVEPPVAPPETVASPLPSDSPAAPSVSIPEPQPEVVAVAVAEPPPVGDLGSLWQATHESVRAENGLLGAVLDEAVPTTVTEEELALAFAPSAAFLKRKAEDPANRAIVIETLRNLTGRRYRVSFELSDELKEREGENGAPPTEEEIVARLMAELDAEELPADWLQQQKGEE
jgi:DNA polymerase-3 subunit gamma/tau